MKQPPLLEVESLSVSFFAYDKNNPSVRKKLEAKAVNNLSFKLEAGETLSLVGESGCGKTMTAFAIMGLVPEPGKISSGKVLFLGQDLRTLPEKKLQKIRGNELAMIFQEPMTALNPVLTIGSQIEEAILVHKKIDKPALRSKVLELLGKVGIPSPTERYNDYPHQLSGGMRQRIVIAMALACDPKLIIADEPTTALDVTIQRQILDLLADLSKEMNTATLLITHDLGLVKEVSDQVIVMYAGQIMEHGQANVLFEQPLHPYTAGLIASSPKLPTVEEMEQKETDFQQSKRLSVIPGAVPNIWNLPTGCPFNTRCPHAFDP